jgi:hypothetical protein
MNATLQLHDLGQSLWLDNIKRALLTSGTQPPYQGVFRDEAHLQSDDLRSGDQERRPLR